MGASVIKRLEPPEWLVTPLGEAEASYLIDRGPEHHVQWICWVIESGECWVLRNPEVRRATNVTMGRDLVSLFGAETMARFARFRRDREKDDAALPSSGDTLRDYLRSREAEAE